MLLTNHPLLVSAAERNYDRFKVSTSLIESVKSKRYYTPEQQADLDIKTSVNKIGEIVNLSQEIQTLMWHMLNNGKSWEEIKPLYYDACQLNAQSGAEIDMAKKEFDINNEKELQLIRERHVRRDAEGRMIKPYFFGHVDRTKGYYNEEKKKYMKHDTSMDYLREILENYKFYMTADKPLSNILIYEDYNKKMVSYRQIDRIVYMIDHFKKSSYYIWNGYAEDSDKYKMYLDLEADLIDSINKIMMNQSTMYRLIPTLESDELTEFTFKILFNLGNEAAFNLIKDSQRTVSVLEESPDGDIVLYDKKYKKSQK